MNIDEQDFVTCLGDRIKHSIKMAGITQKKCCEKIGLSENALVNYIKGYQTPSSYILYKIGEATNTDPSWLFMGIESKVISNSQTQSCLKNLIAFIDLLRWSVHPSAMKQLRKLVKNLELTLTVKK